MNASYLIELLAALFISSFDNGHRPHLGIAKSASSFRRTFRHLQVCPARAALTLLEGAEAVGPTSSGYMAESVHTERQDSHDALIIKEHC